MDSSTALFREAWTEMDKDLCLSLRKLEDSIDREDGEFTARDAFENRVFDGVTSHAGVRKKLARLQAGGKLTARDAYDPVVKKKVKAYKIKD